MIKQKDEISDVIGMQAMRTKPETVPDSYRKIVLIGSSTGGVDALVQVLSDFPKQCPATVIVQHTGPQYGQSLARLLDARCAAPVRLCEDDMRAEPGVICLAAGTKGHAVFSNPTDHVMSLIDDAPTNGHLPSVDRLFMSAVPLAKRIVAAVLTGMGNDGAAGLLALRRAGAATLSQDKDTSVVYGMPRLAWENGGAALQLPIQQIGQTLLSSARACK